MHNGAARWRNAMRPKLGDRRRCLLHLLLGDRSSQVRPASSVPGSGAHRGGWDPHGNLPPAVSPGASDQRERGCGQQLCTRPLHQSVLALSMLHLHILFVIKTMAYVLAWSLTAMNLVSSKRARVDVLFWRMNELGNGNLGHGYGKQVTCSYLLPSNLRPKL